VGVSRGGSREVRREHVNLVKGKKASEQKISSQKNHYRGREVAEKMGVTIG